MEKMLIRKKITLKVNKSEPNIRCSRETLNLDNSSKKREIQKNLFNFEFYKIDSIMKGTGSRFVSFSMAAIASFIGLRLVFFQLGEVLAERASNIRCSRETLNLDNSTKKSEIQKIFLNFEFYTERASY